MNPYIEQNILNADPVELIRILYRHGIASVRDAREQIRAGRRAEAIGRLLRAATAIAELNGALRPEAAPEITARLSALYEYIQCRIFEAAANQDERPLTEALGLMTTLLEAWQFNSEPARAQTGAFAWQAAMVASAPSDRIEVHA